jgi:hypothetical protein
MLSVQTGKQVVEFWHVQQQLLDAPTHDPSPAMHPVPALGSGQGTAEPHPSPPQAASHAAASGMLSVQMGEHSAESSHVQQQAFAGDAHAAAMIRRRERMQSGDLMARLT